MTVVSIAAVLTVPAVTDNRFSVLISTLGTGELIGLMTVIALCCLAVGLSAISVTPAWLFLLLPARIAAVAATCLGGFMWVLVSSGTTVFPLIDDGCDTGYVVQEKSFLTLSSGTVFRRSGIVVTPIAHASGDDGYHPFADGAYAVRRDGDTLDVWYDIQPSRTAEVVTASDNPAFVLPVAHGRSASCGLTIAGTRGPRLPAAPPADTPTIAQTRAGVDRMVRATLGAAVGSVHDGEGNAVDAATLDPDLVACARHGAEVSLQLTLRTGDDDASLQRILAVWDGVGYQSHGVGREKIRSSDSLPVAKMSVRNLEAGRGLQMQITSRCSVVD